MWFIWMLFVWLQPCRGPCLSLCFLRRLAQHVPFERLCTKLFGTCLRTWRNSNSSQEHATHTLSSASFLWNLYSCQISSSFPISELANQLRVYSWVAGTQSCWVEASSAPLALPKVIKKIITNDTTILCPCWEASRWPEGVRSEFVTGRSPVQILRHFLLKRINFTEKNLANIQIINWKNYGYVSWKCKVLPIYSPSFAFC